MPSEETEQKKRTATFWDSVEHARKALNRYHHAVMTAAQAGHQDPQGSARAQAELLSVHTSTISAFLKLRPYIRSELDEFWEGDEDHYLTTETEPGFIFFGEWIPMSVLVPEWQRQVPAAYRAEYVDYVGLEMLDDYQMNYRRESTVERRRHHGEVEETVTWADLLPPGVYSRAINLLGDALLELGFSPSPDKRVPRTEITEEDIQKVKEWHKQNA